MAPKRLCVIASASGNGKTTLARTAAAQMGVRFVELDALVHGPAGPRHQPSRCALS